MTTTPINIVLKYKAIQYDGTNSAQIDGLITYFDITSESGGVLHADSSSGSFTINTNDYVVYNQGSIYGVHSPTDFNTFYICNSACEDTAGFASGTPARAVGVASVPALLLNASTTVGVTLTPAMPDTSYTANAFPFNGVVLAANLQVTSVSIVSASLVNVVVQSVGVATLAGANVMVVATA